MADLTRKNKTAIPETFSIHKFGGINNSMSEAGEAKFMKNFRITDNFKLQRRPGSRLYCTFGSYGNIRGAWYGRYNNEEVLYVCAGNKIVKYDGVYTQIGTIGTNTGKVNIFPLHNRLYFFDGTEAYTYDTSVFGPAEPYKPILYVQVNELQSYASEAQNLLTRQFRIQYNYNHTTYVFNYMPVESVQSLTINGADYTNAYDFAINPATGSLTVTAKSGVPASGIVHVTCTMVPQCRKDEIFANKYHAVHNEDNDNVRLFLYGVNNTVYFTEDISKREGMYVTVGNKIVAGDPKNTITSICRQFEDLVIFTENDTWVINNPVKTADSVFRNTYHCKYSLSLISSAVGNVGQANVRQIDYNLISAAADGAYLWGITRLFDERNVKYISLPIRNNVNKDFWSGVIALDNRRDGEVWFYNDGDTWIYNYRTNVWYYYDNIAADGFVTTENVSYYSGAEMFIMDENCDTDAGIPFDAAWESQYIDFGLPQYTKSLQRLFVTLQPYSCLDEVKLIPDKGETAVFENLNSSTVPVTHRLRLKINRCIFAQLILRAEEKVTVSGVKVEWVRDGEGNSLKGGDINV